MPVFDTKLVLAKFIYKVFNKIRILLLNINRLAAGIVLKRINYILIIALSSK